VREQHHEPLTGSFFRIEFSMPQGALVVLLLAGSAYSAWGVYKGWKTGIHSFRGRDTVRADAPRMFAFDMIVTSLVGICAFIGAIILFFDLGVKP
jgi:hypothetical protein